MMGILSSSLLIITLLPHWRIHHFGGLNRIVLRRVRASKQGIQLPAQVGFQNLDLGVGHAEGAVDLKFDRPPGFFIRMSSSSCCRPSQWAGRFPLSGHNPTRGYGRVSRIAGRNERSPGRLAILTAAGLGDPPLAG